MPFGTDKTGLRKLWPSDLAEFRDHLLRLDPASRHRRFAMAASDEFLADYAARSFDLSSVIHGVFEGERLRGVGELRLIAGAKREAEAAFSVEEDWQARGFGSALMERTLLAARNRGIRRIWMNCLATNRRMQQLARRHGAELEYEGGDVTALVLPPRASPVSLMREAVSDGYGWAAAVFELQSRLIRSA